MTTVGSSKHVMSRQFRVRKTTILTILFALVFSPTFLAIFFLTERIRNQQQLGQLKPAKIHSLPAKVDYSTSRSVRQPQLSLEDCSLRNSETCCTPWGINTDDWWTRHPEWSVAKENFTHSCFRRTDDPVQLAFIQRLHSLQWGSPFNSTDCQKTVQKPQISSGYAAALMDTARSFYASFQSGVPFQITRAHDRANWNFSPKDPTHWAHCSTVDMHCYYLSISPCSEELGRSDAPRGSKPSKQSALDEFRWLRQYAYRPRHVVRHHLQDYLEKAGIVLEELAPCTAIHVRRGDIAFGKGRRYAAVDEYLERGNVKPGDTVVLLTDDVSAVEEVENYLKDEYNWIYLDRPRFRGSAGGFEGFIPSKDPALEILAIMAEMKIAAQCNKLVHGKSGFVAVITEAMENAGNPYETFYLQTQQNKQEQAKMNPGDRAEVYLERIRERLENRKQQKFATTS